MSVLLRQARQTRGWSSARLRLALKQAAARRAVPIAADSSLRVMLSRWENGRAVPDPVYRMLLEEVFELPADALGIGGAECAKPTTDLFPLINRTSRHLDPNPVVVEYFTTQLTAHARLDNLTGPSFVLATAAAQLSQLETLAAPGSSAMARLAARFAEFTGWLHQDSGDPRTALQLTARAIDYADTAGDDQLSTYSIMRKANVLSVLGQNQLAAVTSLKALANATRHYPSLVPVCLRQHALASARLRDEASTREAIDTGLALSGNAIRAGEQLSPYCTTSYLHMEAALCLLSLRQPRDAEQACTTALANWPAELVRDRTLCLARRGIALVEMREVDEACAVAMLAIQGSRVAPSGRTVHMLRAIVTRLRPYGQTPCVRELTTALAQIA